MSILADKVLSLLVFPLGLTIVGLMVGSIALLLDWKKFGRALVLLITVLLWIASTPKFADFMARSLEEQYPLSIVERYPQSDVAIVLGGLLRTPTDRNPYPDLDYTGDRLLQGFRIYKAGKAKKILLSGGSVFDRDALIVEVDSMADMLVSFGVDRSAILLERHSRNTYENARFSAAIWKREGFRSGLLVTSALHMPRALAVFRTAGLQVMPATTDLVPDLSGDPVVLSLLPNAISLDVTTKAIKEWIGLLVYRWRGWA